MKKLLGSALLTSLAMVACTSELSLGQGNDALGGLGQHPKSDGTCDTRLLACSQVCIDSSVDPNHCGACGVVCGGSCQAGKCTSKVGPEPVLTCGQNETACGTTCKSLAVDHDNCGVCGKTCGSDEQCTRAVCTSTGVTPQEETVGLFAITQADHDVTQLYSMATRYTALPAKAAVTFGACQLYQEPTTVVKSVQLDPPYELTFHGGTALANVSLLALTGSGNKNRLYSDNRTLGTGGSPTWWQGGTLISAESLATADVPAIAFPQLAGPSRFTLGSTSTFMPATSSGVRNANDVGQTNDIEIAWTTEDSSNIGRVHLQLAHANTTKHVFCDAPVGQQKLTVPAAALAILGAGQTYLYANSSSSTSIPVAGFTRYTFSLTQTESGRSATQSNQAVVFNIL